MADIRDRQQLQRHAKHGQAPQQMDDGQQRMQNKIHFFKNLSMIGSALYIAATAECD